MTTRSSWNFQGKLTDWHQEGTSEAQLKEPQVVIPWVTEYSATYVSKPASNSHKDKGAWLVEIKARDW